MIDPYGQMQFMRKDNFNQQGIGQFLSPLISAINNDYNQDVIQPYVQEVENLTTSTFPDFDMGVGVGGQIGSGVLPDHLGSGVNSPAFGGGLLDFGRHTLNAPEVDPTNAVNERNEALKAHMPNLYGNLFSTVLGIE